METRFGYCIIYFKGIRKSQLCSIVRRINVSHGIHHQAKMGPFMSALDGDIPAVIVNLLSFRNSITFKIFITQHCLYVFLLVETAR